MKNLITKRLTKKYIGTSSLYVYQNIGKQISNQVFMFQKHIPTLSFNQDMQGSVSKGNKGMDFLFFICLSDHFLNIISYIFKLPITYRKKKPHQGRGNVPFRKQQPRLLFWAKPGLLEQKDIIVLCWHHICLIIIINVCFVGLEPH